MPTPDSIFNLLRQETAHAHRALEDAVRIARQLQDVIRYQQLLQSFLGYYEPMEARIASRHDWTVEGIEFEARRKAPWLKQDLAALGLSPQEIAALPACDDLPALDDAAAAFGAFYVLEGSTLGGRHISAMLRESPVPENARTFFNGYGERTGAMWKEFSNALEQFAEQKSHQKIIQGADATFRCLQQWIVREALPA